MSNLDTIGGLHYEMMKRCYDEKSVMYNTYGAKGIKVCDEWHDREVFRKWCKDNGWNKSLRLNRIDGTKDYCPENCIFGNKNCKDQNSAHQKLYRNIRQNKAIKKELGIERYTDSPLYRKHKSMMERCYDGKNISYPYYGARGIDVCFEWRGKDGVKNFIAWSMRNGYKHGLSLDRIDNNKGYYPENCRWVTIQEQAINKRRNKKYEWKGQTLILAQISRMENISYSKLYRRINNNHMSIKDAIEDIKKSTE